MCSSDLKPPPPHRKGAAVIPLSKFSSGANPNQGSLTEIRACPGLHYSPGSSGPRTAISYPADFNQKLLPCITGKALHTFGTPVVETSKSAFSFIPFPYTCPDWLRGLCLAMVRDDC